MKKEINSEFLKKTDNETAEIIEKNFVPDWKMNDEFEKSYEKYTAMKNNSDAEPDENSVYEQDMISADVVPEKNKWKNIVIKIAALSAAAAVIFSGIKFLPSDKSPAVSEDAGFADNHVFTAAADYHGETETQENNGTDSTDLISENLSELNEMYDTWCKIDGKENNSGTGVKKYSTSGSSELITPQFDFSYIQGACFAGDILYVSCDNCLAAVDSETGELIYSNTGIMAGTGSDMYFDGQFLVITHWFDGTIWYIDRELKGIQKEINCYDLIGYHKKTALELYGEAVLEVSANKDGTVEFRVNGEPVDNPGEPEEEIPEIRCIRAAGDSIYIATEFNDITELYAFDLNGNKLWKKEYPEYQGIGYELYDADDNLIFVTYDYSVLEQKSNSFVHITDKKDGTQINDFEMENSQFVYFDYESGIYIGEHLSDSYCYNSETGEKSVVPGYAGYDTEDMRQSGKDLVIIPFSH